MAKDKVYLCTCITVGCDKERTWSEAHGSYVTGAQVSKALYFRHRKLDQWVFKCSSDGTAGDGSDVGDTKTWPPAGFLRQHSPTSPLTERPPPLQGTGTADSDLNERLKRTATIEASAHDLGHITTLINFEILSFSVNGPLCFSSPPNAASLEYDLQQPIDYSFKVNAGPLQLQQSSALNQAVLQHENHLAAARTALEDMQVLESLRVCWDELIQRIRQELERVMQLKMMEWNRQVREIRSSNETSSRPGPQAVQVNTDSYFQFGSGSLHPAVAAAMFLVLVLTLLCGVSRKQAGFSLVVLKQMIHWLSGGSGETGVDTTILPRDPRTLLQFFDLNPRLRSYTCCPSCFALYPDSAPVPDNCTNQKASDEPSCDTSLFRTKTIRGRSFRRPIRKYVHQEMKHWVARLLSQRDIEQHLNASSSSGHATLLGEIGDIHEANAVQSLLGPDRMPFVSPQRGGELRLIFSLCTDGLNAFAWGVNAAAHCGDGHCVPGFQPPPQPLNSELITGLRWLQRDSAEKNTVSLKRPVLWHLCQEFGLRRVGTNTMLSRTLDNWYDRSTEAKVRVENLLGTLRQGSDDCDASGSELSSSEPCSGTSGISLTSDGIVSTSTNDLQSQSDDLDIITPTAKGKQKAVGGTRRPRNDPPSLAELDHARRKLITTKSIRTAGTNIRVPTLYALCKEFCVAVDCPSPRKLPKKAVLLDALERWQNENGNRSMMGTTNSGASGRVTGQSSGDTLAPLTRQSSSRESVVLGDVILAEIWKDQEHLHLPSFIAPAPAHFGSEKRTLSADQWRSVSTIHLVITLIRLWGLDSGRKGEMLTNFMHLVTAVHLVNSRTTSRAVAKDYTFHMMEYLQGYCRLYKEAKIQPSHHLSLHMETLLMMFGPVHSWRTWPFECYNYTLQNIKTNRKFGELELTYINDSCRSANLVACLFNGNVPAALKELWPAFQQAFRADIRGTRINDILGFGNKAQLHLRRSSARGWQAKQDKQYMTLAMQHLKTQNQADVGFAIKLCREGMCFQPSSRSPNDANVILQNANSVQDPQPARLLALFTHRRNPTAHEVYAIIERHVELSSDASARDPYRRFGFAAAGYIQNIYSSETHVQIQGNGHDNDEEILQLD
ncbi:hypothetical protein M404DRAFT_9134 [Pisolithus tinctorius Marx 270]|uniref:Uncharacterized protein n=1 Tax=Pisolithus tinctorius Marx 270 TaxID=870435 RepID=A0A0C3K6A2_PISTI|nr:hypothetical protein M404DRAFT_9134 [Pisolithus tinctorius Marx 270]